jgi:acetate---CoA ligase (ADP-forming)
MSLDLSPLLWPRSLAIVGASPDTSVIRGKLMQVLLARGFSGVIYPVTRSHAEVQGHRAWASIAELPESPDLAVIVIPAAVVPQALEECGDKGVRAAVIISSGFAEERGDAGRQLQERLREIAARHGMLVCGPNSEGVVNLLAPMVATFSPALEHVDGPLLPEISRGRTLGVTAQSGAISFAYFNRGRPRQLRFGYLVSTGNEGMLEGLDYVDWMLDDGRTEVVLMYVEAMRDGERFRRVAAKAARAGRPLVVAKVGRSEAGRRAALSHTGSLAGSDAVYDAMFRRYGVVRADDLDEMLDAAAAFSFCPLPAGRRVGLLTGSGGGAVWMADLLAAHGLEVPPLDEATRKAIDALIPSFGSSQNPVDLTAQSVRQVGYARVIDILRRSPSVDMVVVVGSLAYEHTVARDLEALGRLSAESDKPIVFCAYTLASPRAIAMLAGAGIPAYTGMGSCARALRALAGYAEFQRQRCARAAAPAAPLPGVPAPAGAGTAATPAASPAARAGADKESLDAVASRLAAATRSIPEAEAKELLAAYGIPRPPEALVDGEDAAVAAAVRLGLPVALKVQSPDIVHKTEAGALALGLGSDAAVRDAYRLVVARARAYAPGAAIGGVLVQRMVPPGREMIAGISRDPVFGPMLVVGLGGVWVEALGDVALSPVPIDRDDALTLVRRLRGAALLDGFRGEPPSDVGALADLLVGLSRFAADHAALIDEIDLNPVIVHPVGQGVSVVDALIVPRR